MAEPAPSPAAGAGRKMQLWIAIAAVIIVIVVAGAAVAVLTQRPPTQPPPEKIPIELWYNNDGHYGDTETALALTLQNSIESCGRVDVTLKSDPWAVYRQNWANQRMPLFLLGWYPDYFDSDDYISPFLSVSGAKSLGSFYNNSQVDGWITEEQSTTDPAVRTDRFTKIQTQLAEDVPYIPLFAGVAQAAHVNGVRNVELHPVTFKWFIVDRPGNTILNVSTSDKIISLDPASAYDFFSIEIINQVFDTLLVYDWKNATLKPGLAAEVPTRANGLVSADGMSYTYNLRPGITFHDGTPLTAQIVADSINRAVRLDLAASAAFLLYDVGALGREAPSNNTRTGAIEVVDPDTIRFNLARPVSFFNDLMAFSVAAPVHPSYSQTGEQPSTVGSVIGTGPYRLAVHVPNQLVVLDRAFGTSAVNTYYNRDLYAPTITSIPKMDQVVINIRASAAALKQDIETKTVDVVFRTLTPSDLVDLQNRAGTLGISVKLGSSPQIRYLVFNVNKVPDKRVRQAIAHSVDRAAISQIVFLGTSSPLYSMIPPEMPFSSPVFQSRYGDARCSDANALLNQLSTVGGYHSLLQAATRDF